MSNLSLGYASCDTTGFVGFVHLYICEVFEPAGFVSFWVGELASRCATMYAPSDDVDDFMDNNVSIA